MRRAAWWGGVGLLAAGLVFFAGRTAAAVRDYAAAPRLVETAAAEGERGFRLALPPGDPLAGAAAPGRAVVFVYGRDCAASRDNLWNWADVLVAARGRAVRFYAAEPARPGAPADPRHYWGGMARAVTAAAAPADTLHARFRVSVTPATLLVENGTVVRTYVGPLTPAARRGVLRFVAGAAPGG